MHDGHGSRWTNTARRHPGVDPGLAPWPATVGRGVLPITITSPLAIEGL